MSQTTTTITTPPASEEAFLQAILDEFGKVYADPEWEWDVLVDHAQNVEQMVRDRLEKLKGGK